MSPKRRKIVLIVHGLLVALELLALVSDVALMGLPMFRYYTVDSNVLQLIVSCCILYWLLRRGDKPLPEALNILHLIASVCLTITFLIVLLVLAPQEGYGYNFLYDAAPVNHLLGPALSVIAFLLPDHSPLRLRRALPAPMAATLLYGLIALGLNALKVLDGPYFFLRIGSEAPSTILMWFGIIAALCLGLSALYLYLRNRKSAV